jgi:hypothetical protein
MPGLTLLERLARGHTEACINVLFKILLDADAPLSARTKAAETLLSSGLKSPGNVRGLGE